MPSATITVLTPSWDSTSRSRRERPLGFPPQQLKSFVTALPLMPSLTTPRTPTRLPTALSRAARKSGQRRLVLDVEFAPSVIESPSATTAPI